jgi:hypothetical protein
VGLASSSTAPATGMAYDWFTLLAPNLNVGARPTTEEETERELGEAEPRIRSC